MSHESEISRMFYEHDVCVNCLSIPRKSYIPFGEQMQGIDVHNKHADFVTRQLDRLGIEYIVHSGRYRGTRGKLKHKRFKFIEIPNHEQAYEKLVAGGIV